jgi:hypothetical protein
MTVLRRGQGGYVTLLLPMLVFLASLAAIATIDVTAYLAAASRAQALADAAALAAVTVDATHVGSPRTRAVQVTGAGGGRLETCGCPAGGEYAEVEVSVEVPGLFIPEVGAGRVTATSAAVLTRPELR